MGFPLDAATPMKAVRKDTMLSHSPSSSTSVGSSSASASENLPSDEEGSVPVITAKPSIPECAPSSSTSVGSSSASLSETLPSNEEGSVPIVSGSPSNTECAASCQDHCKLNEAVAAALKLYKEAWVAFAIERDAGHAEEMIREDRASKFGEIWAAERYENMKDALLDLLPWLGPMQSDAQDASYQVVEYASQKPPRHFAKGSDASADPDEAKLKAHLEWLRSEPRGRAWEALCALMAGVSSRKEKCWMEAFATREWMEEKLATMPLCKSKKSAQRKCAIRTLLEKECSSCCGFFSHYLRKPDTHLRVAFATGVPTPTPSCLVVTRRLPLWDALKSLDDGGPLRGQSASRDWSMAAGRQFAFQTANLGVKEEFFRKCRASAEELQPDPKLRDLIRSKKNVVVLEVVAALAPRDVAKREGLGDIVKAELARVMREAKSRGEAVIFCLGSDSPHLLAEKVYLRKPIADHGLQCGYLRCRASADAPWSREREWSDRICLCFQMP